MQYDIKNPRLAAEGVQKIDWASREMPVLRLLETRLAKEKPFAGLRIGMCMHVTSETANLVRALLAGGASLAICASNPLSTQDDVAAALVRRHKVPVFAIRGENQKTYAAHLRKVLATRSTFIIDDGADLAALLLDRNKASAKRIRGACEETTTGVTRLRQYEQRKKLLFPVIAVNEAKTKYLFDNRYGTGQSTIDGILRATNILLAGKTVVVAGYGSCGRGVALRAKGMGANVVITEINPVRSLEARLDGYWVMSMQQAAPLGDIFITATGNCDVIDRGHMARMKDGALLANAGHFDVEISVSALRKISKQVTQVREYVSEHELRDGKKLYLLAEGRLVNLVAGEGHPASVMDMSFANQALCLEYLARLRIMLAPKVYPVPSEVDEAVAKLKLRSMGIRIDQLTAKQKKYIQA